MHNQNHYCRSDAMGWPAFIAGGLIGAGIALLCAPQRGTEKRSRLRDYAGGATDELMEQGREVWDTQWNKGRNVMTREKRSSGMLDDRNETRQTGTVDGRDSQ